MDKFDPVLLKKLFIPDPSSHKGQNGKLLLIGGSKLFHAASLWALKVASRIIDMVFYSSVSENNEIVKSAKKEFRDGIIVPRNKIENYINEADCILIGPGMPRKEGEEEGDDNTKLITENFLKKYPDKKWVIDGGSLQTIDPSLIPENSILTPHPKEFQILKSRIQNLEFRIKTKNLDIEEQVRLFAKEYNCLVLLKGPVDIISDGQKTVLVEGGNAGMTKGGTGDVLSGLVAALYCKNDAFLAACIASYVNKKAGEELFKKTGYYFNSSDLADQVPKTLSRLTDLKKVEE